MQEQDYTNRLREMIHLLFPDSRDVSSNREITINCPICAMEGDPDHGKHMYISLGYDHKPPMYNCFRRIGHSGLLTKSFLERFSENPQYLDNDLMNQIEKSNQVISDYGRFSSIRKDKLDLVIPHHISNPQKTKYINDRLGLSLTEDELVRNKVILSLYDFLRYNKVPSLTRETQFCDVLDRYYVGFLTNTNMAMIMRNTITNKELLKRPGPWSMRYTKYNIIQGPPENYYLIPTSCDIYKPIDINIAEGPFDILSIFYNLHHADRKNKVFGAVGSKAYINLIRYFYTMYGLINVRFHIYIDSGVEKPILDNIAKLIKPICSDVYIHMNIFQGEKDFGVPLSRIREYVYRL